MTNKYTIITTLLLITSLSANAQRWTSDMYNRYNDSSFFKSELSTITIDPNNIDYELLNAAIFYASNVQRKKKNRAIFKHSASLETAAFDHSKDMVEKNFFSHTSKVEGKVDLYDRLKIAGIKNTEMAENIAITFTLLIESNESYIPPSNKNESFKYYKNYKPVPYHTYASLGENVVKQWMNSPGHSENLLNTSFLYLGCGAYLKNDDDITNIPKLICTQNFCKRLPSDPNPQMIKASGVFKKSYGLILTKKPF